VLDTSVLAGADPSFYTASAQVTYIHDVALSEPGGRLSWV